VKRLVRSTSVPIAQTVDADDQVAFPVPGDGAIVSLGGPLADEHLVGHESVAAAAGAGARHPQCAAGA